MNDSELKLKIDALSMRSKRWLHTVCNQIADADGYSNIPTCRDECAKAGLLKVSKRGYITMAEGVMGLVYSDSYLAKTIAREIVPNAGVLDATLKKRRNRPIC